MVFPVNTLSQPNYSYGCFVVGVVVVVGLLHLMIVSYDLNLNIIYLRLKFHE